MKSLPPYILGGPGGKAPWGERVAIAVMAFAAFCCALVSPAWSADNPNGIAVIIGNQDYKGDVPKVTYAGNDAEAMQKFVVDALGYPKANVFVLSNATYGELVDWFGTADDPNGRLANRVKKGVSDVVVFYSGHGVPFPFDPNNARPYLLPTDGNPDNAARTAYPVDVLQRNLAALGARSVTVYLDACFSGGYDGGGLLGISGTFSVTPREVANLTVITATSARQVASWDPAAKHGLFTEYLLKGLGGAADGPRYGNGDGAITAAEVMKYLDTEMSPIARQRNRDQNATLAGAPATLLAALPPKPVGPVITAFDGQLFANVTANVRTGPDAGTAPLGAIDRGAAVAVTGKSGEWYRVQLADGRVGFVLGTLLQAQPIAPLAPPAPPPTDPAQIELAFWNSIQASRNVADFDAYLRQYPKGSFVALANNRIAELRAAPVPAAPAQQQAAAEARTAENARADDDAAWERVRNSTQIGEVQGYLARYPAGAHFQEANTRLQTLNALALQQQAAAAAPRPAPVAPAPAGPQVASGLYTRPGDVFRDIAEGPEMVVIPAGRFTMGSPSTEVGRFGDEGPTHVVTIAKSFAVSKYEVTFAEWDACVTAGGCGRYRPADEGWGRGSRPVINVSWNDAKGYVAWLSQRTGQQYRLLTESEWEYAARAGTTTTYYWGNDIGRGNANCNGCGTQWDGKQTAPAGSFKANSFGLHDMLGNVYEWVEDCWHDSYAGAPTDGAAWTANCTSASRVLRGGSWVYDSGSARSANRVRYSSDLRNNYVDGFRVARTL